MFVNHQIRLHALAVQIVTLVIHEFDLKYKQFMNIRMMPIIIIQLVFSVLTLLMKESN